MGEAPIILHHYWRSPFSEKVRLAFGLKRLSWRSVEQARLAPKPLLTALTGGYRRIPVMQIGADIYCDSRCILRELERRYPEPTLYPAGTAGIADMLEAFADRFLFADALGLVFGLHGDRFPAALHADRERFTANRFDAWNPARMSEKLASLPSHFAAHLGWLESLLADGRNHLLGPEPGLADLAAYHPLWYAGENLDPSESKLDGYPCLARWRDRMATIGHGEFSELDPSEALAIAAASQLAPDRTCAHASGTPVRRASHPVSHRVSITPDDWGFDPVEGELVFDDPNHIVLDRVDPDLGKLRIHFPHVGFVIRALD